MATVKLTFTTKTVVTKTGTIEIELEDKVVKDLAESPYALEGWATFTMIHQVKDWKETKSFHPDVSFVSEVDGKPLIGKGRP